MSVLDFINYMKSKKVEKREIKAAQKLSSLECERVKIRRKIFQAEDSFDRYFTSIQPELYGALKRFVDNNLLQYCKSHYENDLIRNKYIKSNKSIATQNIYRSKFCIIDELDKKSLVNTSEGLAAEKQLQDFLTSESNPDFNKYRSNLQLINALGRQLVLIEYNPDLDDAFFEAQLRVHKVLSMQNSYNAKVETYNNLLDTYKNMFPNFEQQHDFQPLEKYKTPITTRPTFKIMQEVLNPVIVEERAKEIVNKEFDSKKTM